MSTNEYIMRACIKRIAEIIETGRQRFDTELIDLWNNLSNIVTEISV